jgi:hypothetical protein
MKFVLPFIVIFLLLLSSCREDVINPQNTGGNINEPIAESTGSAYIFSINGENISYSVVYSPNLNTANNNVYLTLTDHASGGIFVTVYDPSGEAIFSYGLNSNVDNNTFSIFSREVDKIKFSFENFTGKFRFEIAPTN